MNKEALTAPDVAGILKISQNTVYELVKRGELRCYKIGRKMRFTYEDVQNYIHREDKEFRNKHEGAESDSEWKADHYAGIHWLPSSDMEEDLHVGHKAAPGTFRISGHDEILDVLARTMYHENPSLRIERIHKDSYNSLISLYKDQVEVAASHIWDERTNTYNKEHVEKMLPGCETMMIRVATRTEGFFVAEDNPKQIMDWSALGREELVFANREPGAGTRILLDGHLKELHINPERLKGYHTICGSHMEVAALVSKGEADFGIGTQKIASGFRGISFVPLQQENYDLVVKTSMLHDPTVQLMLQILRNPQFQEQFRYLAGYDVTDMGMLVEME